MSSRAILGPGVSTPAVFAAAATASRSRCRRANASNGVSPARMNNVARSNGVFADDKCVTGPAADALAAETIGVGVWIGGGVIAGAAPAWTTTVGLKRTLRRRLGLDPSSRLSQSRKASGEISTPRPRNAIASTSTESPARRSRSSSSRCASSCAVFGCFGWRAFAANSASVGGGVGAMSWCASGSEGVMWARYSERLRSAMGVGLDQSKPRGLDVGVLTHAFLLFFVIIGRLVKRLLSWSRWIRRWIDELSLRFEGIVRSVSLTDVPASLSGESSNGVIHGFGCRSSSWSSPGGWIGGEVC